MTWPDWFFQKVDGEGVVGILAIAASLLVIMGTMLLTADVRVGRGTLRKLADDWRLGLRALWGFVTRLDTWIGMTMVAFGALLSLIAVIILRNRRDMDLWSALFLVIVSLAPIGLFWAWARARSNNGAG